MPTLLPPSSDVTKSLQMLLRLTPKALRSKHQMVLTTAPHLWTGADVVEGLIIVDVQTILGVHCLWQPSNSVLQDEVYRALLLVGWPASSIRLEYRANARASMVVDLAITDANGRDYSWRIEVQGGSWHGKIIA